MKCKEKSWLLEGPDFSSHHRSRGFVLVSHHPTLGHQTIPAISFTNFMYLSHTDIIFTHIFKGQSHCFWLLEGPDLCSHRRSRGSALRVPHPTFYHHIMPEISLEHSIDLCYRRALTYPQGNPEVPPVFGLAG
jgi:hypothetical protein